MLLQVVLCRDQESEHQRSDEKIQKTVRNVLEVKNKIKSLEMRFVLTALSLYFSVVEHSIYDASLKST